MNTLPKNPNERENQSDWITSLGSSVVSSVDTGLGDVLLGLRKLVLSAALGGFLFVGFLLLYDAAHPGSIAPVLSSGTTALNMQDSDEWDVTGLTWSTWEAYLRAQQARSCRDSGGRWRNNRCEYWVRVCQADQTSGGIGYHCTWKWR